MLTYKSKTGELLYRGALKAKGYSGHGPGVNNPGLQHVAKVGPIPAGVYWISPEPFDSPEHGKFCLRLTPVTGTQTYGRSGFLMHGDEVGHVGEFLASEGCIVQDRPTREWVHNNGHTLLVVEDW